MRRAFASLMCLLTLASGCSGKRDARDLLSPTGAGTIVVDARLIVGDLIPDVRLGTTVSPDQPYNSSAAELNGARVLVTTSGGDSAHYLQVDGGRYRWAGYIYGDTLRIRPATTYFLRVEAADGRIVTAQTTTPDTFQVREWVLLDESTLEVRRRLAAPSEYPVRPDSVFLASSNQLVYQDGLVEARFDRGSAIAFQMALFNLETDSPLLFDADFLSEEDKRSIERESSSPPLDAPDGAARLPWLAVWYEGRHVFRVYSVDRNWYDLTRSLRFFGPGATGIGFGSNAGDDFERPIFHIQGGIGLFGSAAMDETGFYVHPRP